MANSFRWFIVMILLCFGATTYAQEDDQITDDIIAFDQMVTDTITERSIFDMLHFIAQRGDVVVVTMQATDGLAPLVGIANQSRTILARSDEDAQGNVLPPAQPNETITLEFEIPEEGEYVIVATRVGNEAGITTGSYSLLLQRASTAGVRTNDLQAVTFRCGEHIVTTAATLRFSGRADVDTYRISVYGLDGFAPLIRVVAGSQGELTDCSPDNQMMLDDQFILPGEDLVDLSTVEGNLAAAQMGLRGGNTLDLVELSIGSIDGTPGRYLAVIDGFSLSVPADEIVIEALLGPLATSTELLVYMVQVGSSRIDPFITLYGESDDNENQTCDDAGRRGCENVPSIIGLMIDFGESDLIITGTRFDAGLILAPGDIEPMMLGLTSRARNATGKFAIVVIGALPERQSTEDES